MYHNQVNERVLFKFRLRPWQWLIAIAVIFLFAPVFKISNYIVSIGLICATVIALQAVLKVRLHLASFIVLAFFIIFPILNYALSQLIDLEIVPSGSDFITSYGLWVISACIIYLGFNSVSARSFKAAYKVCAFVVAIAVFQAVMARFFGSQIGFSIVQPIVSTDVFDSYTNLVANPRGIATYYEPSMAGRIIATLIFIDILQTGKVARNVVLGLLGLWATSSFGMLVLLLLMSLVLIARSPKDFFLGFALIIGSIFIQQSFFSERTSENFIQTGSTYRRVVAPRIVMGFVLYNYPIGAPMGSGELLATKAGYYNDTGEKKVTNGLIEFMTYFGYIGIGIVLFFLLSLCRFALSDNRELALSLMYLLTSTAASGSFLSIESSLMIFLFTVACRYSYIRRKRSEELGRVHL